jgi:hypothetical protein
MLPEGKGKGEKPILSFPERREKEMNVVKNRFE